MNNRFLLAATLLLSGFSLVGCEVYDPSLISPLTQADCSTTGEVGLIPCPVEGTSTAADMDTADFLLTNITLDQTVGAAWRDIGLDLDFRDTQAPEFVGDCTGVAPAADGTNGIDNQFGATLWPLIQGTLPALQCEINAAHAKGHGALVISLSRWNGLPDDDDVTISIIPAADATSENIDAADCDSITQIGDGDMGTIEFHELYKNGDPMMLRADPILNGNDSVCTNPHGRTNFQPADDITVIDQNAHVTDGIMVFELVAGTDFTLFADRSSVQIRLNQGTLVMPMSVDFQNIEGGFAAGRFPFTALAQVGPEIGICDPGILRDQYQTFVDILPGLDDGADGTDSCDALSVGVGFDGVRANIVGSVPTAIPPFILCDGMGAGANPKIQWPVEACCNSFDLTEAGECSAYYNP